MAARWTDGGEETSGDSWQQRDILEWQRNKSVTMEFESSLKSTLTLPTFNGNDKKFFVWWTRFQAYAVIFGFKKALTDEDDKVRPPSEDTELDATTTEGHEMQAAKERNELAMACLTLAFTSDRLMGLVYRSYTKEWPHGLAKRLVELLLRRYQPHRRHNFSLAN